MRLDEDQSPKDGRLLLEVRTCGLCLGPVVYWEGQFLHLTPACPAMRPR
jgi:hypothetical protein